MNANNVFNNTEIYRRPLILQAVINIFTICHSFVQVPTEVTNFRKRQSKGHALFTFVYIRLHILLSCRNPCQSQYLPLQVPVQAQSIAMHPQR